jgi:TPR repeat protein
MGELVTPFVVAWVATRLAKKRKVLGASLAMLVVIGLPTCRDLTRAGSKPPRLAEGARNRELTGDAALLRRLQQDAEAGDVNAMCDVGVLYYQGAPPDYALARRWWQRAAAVGSANGMYSLGLLYEEGKGVTQDYAQARAWFEKAAAAGNANAMTNLGMQYEHGYGVAQDDVQAGQWYQKAADAGSPQARQQLAYLQQRLHSK